MGISDLYRVCTPDGFGITLATDRQQVVEQLQERFPGEKEAIRKFFDLVYTFAEQMLQAVHFKDPDASREKYPVLFVGLVARSANFHYVPVVEEPPTGYTGKAGFITGELIRETLGSLEDRSFSVCGPQAMYDFCLPEPARLGIPRKRMRREMCGRPSTARGPGSCLAPGCVRG